MTEKTKRIIATIAAEHGITPEEVRNIFKTSCIVLGLVL